MGEFLTDPELDRLIQEMNRQDGEPSPEGEETSDAGYALDPPSLRQVTGDEPLEPLFQELVRQGASDLLLIPGSGPVLRVDGKLRTLPGPVLTGDVVRLLFSPHLGERSKKALAEAGAADFSLRLPVLAAGEDDSRVWRLRVNLQRQRGELAAAVRALPQTIPSLEELNLPARLAELVAQGHGLVLVCGPTGCGKSTTLASQLGEINRRQVRHVITIEDPVEYEHASGRSVFEHVEVGSDAPTFAGALRAALRRDPDVILVGEMRDLETMATTITAAETGHLILSTLHTGDVTRAIHRVVDVFPAAQQDQVRQQLALSLHAVVCQQLIPRADGTGRVPAVETMIATYAIRNHIRKGNLNQLYNEVITGRGHGMQTMETSLVELVRRGLITADEARTRCTRRDELERILVT
jgi:twitching motility protein PilT